MDTARPCSKRNNNKTLVLGGHCHRSLAFSSLVRLWHGILRSIDIMLPISLTCQKSTCPQNNIKIYKKKPIFFTCMYYLLLPTVPVPHTCRKGQYRWAGLGWAEKQGYLLG